VLVLVVALAFGALGAACGADETGGTVRGEGSPAAAGPAEARALEEAGLAFAAGLHREVAAEATGNTIVSPWVVQDLLGQVRSGAGRHSLDELDAVLHLDGVPDERLLAGLHAIRAGMAERRGEQGGDERRGTVVVDHRNELWVQRGTRLDAVWLDGLAGGLDLGVRSVDFRSDPARARTSVEEWAEPATTEPLLPRGAVTDETRLLLPSALRVQAPWARSFPVERSRASAFGLADGSSVAVPTMRLLAPRGLRAATTDDWTTVAVPYLGEDLEMVVVVPTGDLPGFEASLDGEALAGILRSLRATPVSLQLPRFAVGSQLVLDEPLRRLGLVSTLDVEAADLSAMAPGESLAVSGVVTRTAVTVDEEGTGRSAATATDRETPQTVLPPAEVVVDRPFLFLVHDRVTGAVLQIGRVVDPRAGPTEPPAG
jgi:serpin B